MTYCVGILVRDGLVMISDTRTNAGLDNIATYRKLHVFERPGDRVVAIATSGNLAITQSVVTLVTEGFEDAETGETETIYSVPSMFRAAQLVGRAIREVYRVDGRALEQSAASFDVTMLVAGQIKGGRLRLFMVYRAGNFIEATEDTPYLQIGEHKYGKPILDRAATFETNLDDALKLGLLSMDSTIRSNLSVGLPIDTLMVRRDALQSALRHRIGSDDAYFADLRQRWSRALRDAHQAIPTPPYGQA
ncbi:proteasome-type protease [Segnochrobactrum spirostomi]|uniref:Proteasome-type protease n=1 Tax=Segnochrobactrum spirostomi TaxID=2608987 RepID=A0A6A7XZC5_9HYPH|nr:proteasome-type protease [Segnochrobactrum spirostomi]MQT11666.1 proteasome-type protease [Segnochrobactrum spirostomi]